MQLRKRILIRLLGLFQAKSKGIYMGMACGCAGCHAHHCPLQYPLGTFMVSLARQFTTY